MEQLDLSHVFGLFYIALIIITLLNIGVKHEDYNIPLSVVFAVFWPLYWLFLGLTSIFEYHENKRKRENSSETQSQSSSESNNDYYLKRRNKKDTSNTIRGGRITGIKG